ncbi:hypothetical protein SUGI_0364910 [Cryptomeria japonica]|nr:hypothetical protein SUGI_0364910 [Cryptomeria japonica]
MMKLELLKKRLINDEGGYGVRLKGPHRQCRSGYLHAGLYANDALSLTHRASICNFFLLMRMRASEP